MKIALQTVENEAEMIIKAIEELALIPSPTGFTERVIKHVEKKAIASGIQFAKTRKGALCFSFYPEDHADVPGVMFTAHVDTLGAIVREVKDSGLKLSSIGGYPLMYVIGDYCTVHCHDGREYKGTILPENPSAHANKGLSDLKPSFDNLYVRVDFVPENDDDKLTKHVENGCFVSFDPKFSVVNGFVKTRHLDDKASAGVLSWIAEKMAAMIADGSLKLSCPVHFYFNVTEETGQGLAGMPAIDRLIVVDMGTLGDSLQGDEFTVSICPKDSSGPYDYGLTRSLIELCKKENIQYKVDVYPYYGSDGSAVLSAGVDVRTALFGTGVSASHGYERTHVKGLVNTAKLVAAYINDNCVI